MDLDTYLRDELPRRHRDIEMILDVAREAVPVFVEAFDGEGKETWPYEMEGGQLPDWGNADEYSFSTAAMTLFSLSALLGKVGVDQGGDDALCTELMSEFEPGDLPGIDQALKARLLHVWESARKKLLDEVRRLNGSSPGILTESRTFGSNDFLTLGYIFGCLTDDALKGEVGWLDVVEGLVRDGLRSPESLPFGPKNHRSGPHALPVLLAVLLAIRIERQVKDGFDFPKAKKWFEQRLHEHLSHSQLSDASFDAPELVFCLEGLLACDPAAHGMKEILERAADVLRDKQEHNPNLRPYRPLLSNQKGFALLPLTIEVFNSLLRILSRLERHSGMLPVIEKLKPILARYCDWLLGQRTTILIDETPVTGWQSEHTQSRNVIHIWETSQVVLFLVHYAAWLRAEVEREVIAAAGFVLEEQPKKEVYWPDSREDLESFEPCRKARVYERLWDMLDGWDDKSRKERKYSVLLYGPPGTGKSTFAQFISWKLGWPLLSLAPSDFLAGGADKVEQRAKSLFRALNELSETVILFDEIDRLVLDRDSASYEKQSDVFQFMTPSMLPKIQKLRNKQRCVFVIATNYVERIDPAIIRPGRIDLKLAVMPPDLEARKRYLTMLSCGDRVVSKTSLCTYTELEQIKVQIKQKLRGLSAPLADEEIDAVLSDGPSLRMASYLGRCGLVRRKDEPGFERGERAFRLPIKELALSLHLATQVAAYKDDRPVDLRPREDAVGIAAEVLWACGRKIDSTESDLLDRVLANSDGNVKAEVRARVKMMERARSSSA